MTIPRRQSRSERAYRRLLRLLPGDFRSEFGDSMAGDFRDRDRELSGSERGRLWSREFPTMVGTAIAQHVASIWRDVRFALRMMARSPGFTTAAVLMLALGTGANAAMFSVIDAVMVRSAFRDAGRVAAVQEQSLDKPPSSVVPASHVQILSRFPAFEGVAGITGSLPIMTGAGAPRRIDVECVSASMFPLLGVAPELGRVIGPDDDRPGAAPVVVISHRTWMQDFLGAADIAGRTITLNGHANTIIGVMPDGYLGAHIRNRTEAWAALAPAIGQSSSVGCVVRSADDYINVVARVRPPWSLETAAAEINASGIVTRLPPSTRGVKATRIVLERADEIQFQTIRTPFLALLGAVACVLLIACANVTNLQLERLVGRRREMAIRLALGATRGRIVRQTLIENLVVGLIGAACGGLAARVTLEAIVALIPANVPHVREIAVNTRTLFATFGAAVLAGVAVGLVPAIQATKPGVAADLGQSSTRVTGGARWIRRALVVAEVALSMVLLVAAMLTLRTLLTLRPVDPGFSAANLTTAYVLLPGDWKVEPERRRFVESAMTSFAEIPGIARVSATSYQPLSGETSLARIRVADASADVWASWVTPDYFRDMDITLERGRMFTRTDDPGGPPVAIVNEALATRFWPKSNPVGQMIDVRSPDGRTASREIVGIMRTTRSWGTDLEEQSELYVPFAQEPGSTLIYFIMTTNGAPPADLPSQLSARVAAIGPGRIVERVEPLQASLDRSIAQPRFAAWLFGLFAAMAVGLSALGLAAVIAWWVTQRRREIGVRMALGASAERVAALIMRQGLVLALSGVALGVLAAAASTRLLETWLYGVQPLDPLTFAGCAALMLAIAAAAAYAPARRASRIDPIITLRSD